MREYQLPKEFAEKWIAALRSGQYKQSTSGWLLSNDKYCCLGVACSISGIEDKNIIDYRLIVGIDEKLTEQIPVQLMGYKEGGSLVDVLTDLNDTGMPFSKIADWITENVEFV